MNKFDKILGDIDASVNLAVKNLEVSKKFYEDTLGLTQIDTEEEEKELITFKSGNTTIYVYQSQNAGTNKATAVTWVVGEDLEDIVRKLKTRGVTFEHYDMPDMTLENDIHIFGDMKVAWFKDPDDNILNITSR
jgi:catechol 2,3-dioxygenase-like lactoylglutathione lyase family enzyme